MSMNLATKARIKSQLAAKGIYWTDAQIESYASRMKDEPQAPIAATQSPYPVEQIDDRSWPAMLGENAVDFVGSTLWQALDVGTFGLAGLGFKTAAPKTYEKWMEGISDTAGGRVGGAIGGLAGFMVPMGAVARATSLAARGVRGALQARKVKAGLAVAKPTTRTLQKQAAKEIMKVSEKEAKATGGKALTWREAKQIAVESSDDVIGFAQKGWYNNVFGKGPAYQLEHSMDKVNQVRQLMQATMPERLAAQFSKHNIKLGKDQLVKLSDDVVEMIGTKPFNSIETQLAATLSGKFTGPIMNVVGGMAQEAVNFGIVGTVMDAVQYTKGDLDYSEKSFWEQTMHHAMIGSAFGGIRFIPGGRGQSIWNDLKTYSGKATKRLNDQVAKMTLDETKAFARMTMKNDKSVRYTMDKRKVGYNQLKKGTGITESQLPSLKVAIQRKNNETLQQFSNLGDLGPEIARDLIWSLPRMIAGTIVFNIAALQDDAFYNLHPMEAGFHLGLGAVMTKTGRPLIHGKKTKYIGEKDYYYNSDLRDIKQALDRAYLTGDSIEGIAKQFDGNLFTDWIAKNPIEDVDSIIDILKKNNVVYDRTEDGFPGMITPDTFSQVALKNRDLLNLIDPIIPAMQARNIEMNPNVKKAELESALKAIKTIESHSLSTAEGKVFLDSKRNIIKAIYEGSSEKWTEIQLGLLDNLGQQMAVLTEDSNFLRKDGRMIDYTLHEFEGITKAQQKVLGKLEELREQFQDMDIVKLDEMVVGKSKGFDIELSPEKISKLEAIQDAWELDLGKEFYGRSTDMAIDMTDKTMWNVLRSVDYHKNVARVHDVMMGKEVPGIRKEDATSLRSLLHESLSHESNKQTDIIADSPERLKLDPEGLAEPEEYHMLNEMLSQLWSISSASGRRPIDTREVKISLGKARSLKEKLVQAGMPDPELHAGGLDSRMQTWVEKAVSHGMDQVLGTLDLDPYKAEAVRRLMMNGVLQHITDPGGKSLGLQAAHEISITQIEAIMPNITREGAEKIKASYDTVMNELGTKLVKHVEDFQLTGLTDTQLSSIHAAEFLLKRKKIEEQSNEYQDELGIEIVGLQKENSVLRAQLEDADVSAVAQIKGMIAHNEAVGKEYGRMQLSFAKTFGGGIEVSRASANLHFLSTMTDANGKTIHEYLGDLREATDPTAFNSITDQIRSLQEAIANKVAERPDVRTWDDKRQEAIARYKQEEVQGHLPEDREYITPELFFTKHNISIDNVFKEGEAEHGVTYDSAGDVVYELYQKKTKEQFSERMFNLAGSDSKTASSKLRNEVMHIANLFERRFNVKRLVISGDNGGGVFEKGDISKGYLTDHFSEVFLGEAGDMIILSSDYFRNGKIRSIATDDMALQEISKVLDSNTFTGTLQNGGVTNMKYTKEGRTTLLEGDKEYWDGQLDLGTQFIKGRHHVITVDENINLVIPEAGFNRLAESFVRWFEKDGGILNDPYVKSSIKNMPEGAGNLFKILEGHYNRLKEIHDQKGTYDVEVFRDSGYRNRTEHMEDAIYTIFNSMYGEKIDGDWLQDAYFDKSSSYKGYKYRRLAQNQGYSRNSKERQLLLETIHKGTDNKYHAKLIKKFTAAEKIHVAVIDDAGSVSEKGMDALGIITDNRSVAEARLEAQKGDISEKDYETTKSILRDSDAVNAEAINGMTVVSRDLLDYLLLLSGQGELIGESSGQKPVGLSNYTDANGNMHVFYNKTHYFYDSKLDPWFKKNKDITQIAMTSGAKKSKIIDRNDPTLTNKFEPISNIPTIDSGETLYSFINSLQLKAGDAGVMPVNFNETLSGTAYGKPKGVRILKQFDNWTSQKVQTDLYEWARADMLEYLSEVNIHLYNPENIGEASREARSFIRTDGNKDGTMSTDAPNASVASIWIEAGGVPFSEMSKNLYDALIKRRHVDEAGVFDGFTDAGGAPILRGNLSMDLNIPVYHKNLEGENVQVKLGEAHIGAAYLDREIHFKGQFGKVVGAPEGVKLRPKHLDKSALTIAFAYSSPEGKRDVIVNVKDGTITDPLNRNAKIAQSEYKEISGMVEFLRSKLGQNRGISTFRDVVNELKGEGKDVFETSKGSVYVVDGFQTTRTKAATTGRGPGLKERSSHTIYLTEMQARNLVGPLGILKTIGKMAPRKIALGKLGITVDGKNYGGYYNPKKGLRPFEIWTDANGIMTTHHIGHKITKIESAKFDYKGAQLAIMASPAPRTGPHDAMVVKVKGMLDKRDGGLIELNTYDVTSRAMRDMDTDKLPFYMDTPFSAMQEAYRQNGTVKEAAILSEGMKNRPDLDIYSNQSNKAYNEKIQLFKRLRGPVVKMHRKLTYAKRLFDSIDGIDLGDGNKIVFNKEMQDAQQRLVDDSQNILDIYDGTSDFLADIQSWREQTMFGNSKKSDVDPQNMKADQPFFHIRHEDGGKSMITGEVEKAIVRKILNDFGRLLQMESNIYEGGAAKKPRYSDMVSAYRDFRHEYSGKNADWNFYNYIKKSVGESQADILFFKGVPERKDAKMIEPIFSKLADKVLKHPTPFLKSLYKATEKDFAKVRETYGNDGFDFFNNGILKLLGEQRAEAFEIFSRTGIDMLDARDYTAKNSLVSDLWEQFRGVRSHEEMMVQANTLETELRRSERQYEQELKKPNADQAYLDMHAENILIRSEALQAMLNKMQIERGEDGKARYGQEIRSYKFDKDPKRKRKLNVIQHEYKTIAIRDKNSGDFIGEVKPGDKWDLQDNQVAVYNPVVLKSVVEHELIDGAAFGYSVLGRYSNIAETDLGTFRKVVNETKKNIKISARDMMKNRGYRDWTKHQLGVQAAIDRGLKSIKILATKDAFVQTALTETWMGQMPAGKETYGEDFLMALLVPDYSGNPNEFHYSPKTGNFMPSLRAPKSSVTNAVMTSIERYGVVPNYKEFVQEFAQVHRGFYESIVAGRGVHEGMQRLVDSNFESALLNNTIGKVMNNTFMTRKDYKTMDETFDAMPPILSDYAELYRQILQEGAVADPMTAFGLRRQIIEDPTLGQEAYNRIFQLSRGHLVLDGFTAKKYGINKGEGQLLGEVMMSRNDVKRRQITGKKNAERGAEIIDILNTRTGRENTKKEECQY